MRNEQGHGPYGNNAVVWAALGLAVIALLVAVGVFGG